MCEVKPVLECPLRPKSVKPCFKEVTSIKIFSDTSLISKVPHEYGNVLELLKTIFSSIYLLQ